MRRAIPLLLSLAPALRAKEAGATYHFGAAEERTSISFESKTEVLTIVGSTHAVSGSAWSDAGKGTLRVLLVVPVASLKTGYAPRDRVMRSRAWLDERGFPTLEFRAERGTFVPPSTWKIEGEFRMRGVSKALSIAADVREIPDALAESARLGPGRWVRVKTRFALKLSDFGVSIPKASIAQVEDEWTVTVDLLGTTEEPPARPDLVPADDEAPDPTYATAEVSLGDAGGARYRFGVKAQHTTLAAVSESEAETAIVSTVTMAGLLAFDAEKGTARVKLTVPVASLAAGSEARDRALQGSGGLDAANHPHLYFESTKASREADGTWKVEGTLTLRGASKPLAAKVSVQEISAEASRENRWGDAPGLKFETTFALRLSDFGIRGSLLGRGEWTVTLDAIALRE